MIIARLEKVDGTQPDAHVKSLDLLNKNGLAIVELPESNNLRLDFQFFLKKVRLGQPVLHRLSDRFGCVEIKFDPAKPNYISATSGDCGQHTDGSFLPQRIGVIALGCEKAIPNQGVTKLVYGRNALNYLKSLNPKELPLLFREDVLSIERDGERQCSSILRFNQNKKLELRYRGDTGDSTATVKVSPEAQKIVTQLQEYLENPANQVSFALQPGQMILIDNCSFSHSRSNFDPSKPRLLYRWWYTGKASGLELGFMQ